MKRSIIIFFLSFFIPYSLYSAAPDKSQLLSPSETIEVLNKLKPHAIVFGNGPSEIHTFIDPYCELSQRYLSFIFDKQDRMFSKYTFYFYLYELKGKNSSQIITTILSSKFKEISLKAVMLSHEDIPAEDSGETQKVIDTISKAANSIGVFKRPYIIINGKVKE